MRLPRVTIFVKLLLIWPFLVGIGPAGYYRNEQTPVCQGKTCEIYCQFFYLELGGPPLDSPPAYKVFCDPSWDPAREPLRWYRWENHNEKN